MVLLGHGCVDIDTQQLASIFLRVIIELDCTSANPGLKLPYLAVKGANLFCSEEYETNSSARLKCRDVFSLTDPGAAMTAHLVPFRLSTVSTSTIGCAAGANSGVAFWSQLTHFEILASSRLCSSTAPPTPRAATATPPQNRQLHTPRLFGFSGWAGGNGGRVSGSATLRLARCTIGANTSCRAI